MSEYERGKFYGKKRYNAQRAERVDSNSAFGSRFFNNRTVYNPDKDTKESEDENKPKVKQPQILIKAREKTEERSVSPKRSVKENDAKETPVTQIPSESPAVSSLKYMSKSMKLLEDGVLYLENITDYMSESSDYLVCGIIGSQGVGKSTIMNLLATDKVKETLTKSFKQDDPDSDDDGIKILTENLNNLNVFDKKTEHIFKQAPNIENSEGCSNTTSGIDIYITENRVILLDCQPFLSISVFDELIRSEIKRSNIISEFLPLENSGEIQGLQHIAFLMSVCNVLVFVQDYFFDSNNIRFLQTAEMLKPTINFSEDYNEETEHYPHLVILQNKSQMEDYSPNRFKTMQQIYRKMFSTSKMRTNTSMGLGTGRIISSLNPELCGNAFNIFLLPEYNIKTESVYRGHPTFEELIKHLKNNIIGATKTQITQHVLTEKAWLSHALKVWELVKKSSFYVEYTKLMP